MLQIPPQFMQSTKSCWKRHSMVYAASLFGFAILSSMEGSGSFSWIYIIDAGLFFLTLMSGTHNIYCFSADQRFNTVIGYKFIFAPLVLGTIFMTVLNTFSAFEYSAHGGRRQNCGFSFAFAAFMRGTLEGFIAGVYGLLVGTAFIYLALQNIILTCQAYTLFLRFRDDHYRRRG